MFSSPVSPNMKTTLKPLRHAVALAVVSMPWALAHAQVSSDNAARSAADSEDDDVVVLSPVEVSAAPDSSYNTATTLAGNRLSTQLRDVGSADSVVTPQCLRDVGA